MSNEYGVDLPNIERSRSHAGRVQPHGCLIAFARGLESVAFSSRNAGTMLFGWDDDTGGVVGRTFSEVFDSETRHTLRNTLSRVASFQVPGLCYGLPLPASGRCFDVAAHADRNWMILEFEPSLPKDNTGTFELTRVLTRRLEEVAPLDKLFKQATQLLRGLIGYDRIMVCRLTADGTAQVVSETRRPDLDSFDQRIFRAHEISAETSALCVRNRLCVVGDRAATPVPIVCARGLNSDDLDLSCAQLRCVSPIHSEHLRRVGAVASMSIAIVVDGKLWGLIACHHLETKVLTMAERVAADIFGRFFSLRVESAQRRQAEASLGHMA